MTKKSILREEKSLGTTTESNSLNHDEFHKKKNKNLNKKITLTIDTDKINDLKKNSNNSKKIEDYTEKSNEIIINDNGVVKEYKLASFGSRFGARIIDSLIISIPLAFIPLIPAWLYWSLQWSSSDQATIGQKVFNIKIVTRSGKVKFGLATGRFFADLLNIFTFFIGYIVFFFTKKKQALHDLICETYVVKSK